MKRLIIATILLLAVSGADAGVTLTAKAPSTVGVGDQFRLQYIVNSADVSGRPQVGSIAGFELVYGPAVSTSQSIQIINGRASESKASNNNAGRPKRAGKTINKAFFYDAEDNRNTRLQLFFQGLIAA